MKKAPIHQSNFKKETKKKAQALKNKKKIRKSEIIKNQTQKLLRFSFEYFCNGLELLMLNDELVVWPNPASAMLNVKCSMLNEKGNKYKIEMYNAVGQIIFTTKENEIDVSRYARGVYYIKVGNAVVKVVIE